MHQDVSTRIFSGSLCCESMFFSNLNIWDSSSWSRAFGYDVFGDGVIWRTQTLSPRNLNVFRPQENNSSAFSCFFCQTWKLGCDSLQPTGCSDLHLPSHSYTATDRLIMILHVRYLLSLWCWPGSSQNQPRLLRSFSSIGGGSRIHRLKLKICNSWDCISIEIRIGFALSSSFTVNASKPFNLATLKIENEVSLRMFQPERWAALVREQPYLALLHQVSLFQGICRYAINVRSWDFMNLVTSCICHMVAKYGIWYWVSRFEIQMSHWYTLALVPWLVNITRIVCHYAVSRHTTPYIRPSWALSSSLVSLVCLSPRNDKRWTVGRPFLKGVDSGSWCFAEVFGDGQWRHLFVLENLPAGAL